MLNSLTPFAHGRLCLYSFLLYWQSVPWLAVQLTGSSYRLNRTGIAFGSPQRLRVSLLGASERPCMQRLLWGHGFEGNCTMPSRSLCAVM